MKHKELFKLLDEVQEQREERGRGRKSSFENGRGSLGRS